jgi:hypothetical protein
MQLRYMPVLVIFIATIASCSNKENLQSAEKKITSVQFRYTNEIQNTTPGAVYIDHVNRRIVIHPDKFTNTDPDIFRISLQLSAGASASIQNNELLNIAEPVPIIITAEDGSKEKYFIVRSMTDLGFNGRGPSQQYPGMVNVSSPLLTGSGREIKVNANKTIFYFGRPTPSTSGGYFHNNFTVGLNTSNITAAGSAGFDAVTQCTASLVQSDLSLQFANPLDAGKLIITRYDPILKLCSGKIEDITSYPFLATNGKEVFIKVTGSFENIPVIGQ